MLIGHPIKKVSIAETKQQMNTTTKPIKTQNNETNSSRMVGEPNKNFKALLQINGRNK
jgi:hypothetical protein